MPGAMRKMAVYLGLVEEGEHDEDYAYADDYEEPVERTQRAPVHRFDDRPTTTSVTAMPRRPEAGRPEPAAQQVTELSRITTLHPRTYNEARTIGEHFRQGVPVIMNLTEMDDTDAKRLVDFSAGLIFGLYGSIERVTNKVFLLSPANVEVAAEDKRRIAEGGFFNQS